MRHQKASRWLASHTCSLHNEELPLVLRTSGLYALEQVSASQPRHADHHRMTTTDKSRLAEANKIVESTRSHRGLQSRKFSLVTTLIQSMPNSCRAFRTASSLERTAHNNTTNVIPKCRASTRRNCTRQIARKPFRMLVSDSHSFHVTDSHSRQKRMVFPQCGEHSPHPLHEAGRMGQSINDETCS
ncbi:uncharacterized protein K489DRAFT_48935 [Dissoconium aciculare CBS 342.82]|uniref:Uncharacterized protein n=1 Tax=Dissoconium aciculare CBS 342.82 TaxID=1314786 RepID=A0A6J3LY22_9PEZI|nr:uncharacterized protein K489DRAFT_48935 [Dissoconium aciculare CBS 342.82]KAF1820189.1 hypothetical protein K489DRAFT_48935 [Dissoconium aciculare CBS 342.82]